MCSKVSGYFIFTWAQVLSRAQVLSTTGFSHCDTPRFYGNWGIRIVFTIPNTDVNVGAGIGRVGNEREGSEREGIEREGSENC